MIRNSIKPYLFAVAATLTAILPPVAASAETLADALAAAYRNSNLLEQNRATLRAADEGVADAVSSLRPVVSWVAKAVHTDYQANVPTENLTATLLLNAELTLLDFGKSRTSIDIAKESVLATRAALVGVEQNVLLAAVQAYADVKSASEQVAINQNSVRVLGEELKATKDRFEVGEVTRTDVSLAEAQVAAARAKLAAARGTLSVAREAYKAATGHYPQSLAGFPKVPNLPRSLDAARATALQAHPSIKQAQHLVSVSELQMKLAAKSRLPSVTGSVVVGVPEGGNNNYAQATVQASQAIYSGGALSAAHRKAVAGRDASRAGLNEASVSVVEAVANVWSSLDIYRAQINAYDEQIRAARIAYDGVKEEATLGARTTLDVLDAEQTLLDAQASRIDAEAALQVANYQLLAAMGLLTVENLNLGIPTYDPTAYYNAVRTAPYTSTQGESLDRVLRAIGKE